MMTRGENLRYNRSMGQSVFLDILDEEEQRHPTRKSLIKSLESELGRPVVTLFTSFRYPVMLTDADADMLETTLQDCDLSNGLALVISSPGGDGLAAERIIRICRSYSSTGEYWVIVPSKAKSAGTIITFGASKILAGPTSELGPVDPQIWVQEDGEDKQYAVSNIVNSYDDLFKRAVKENKGNIQPYLQQLYHYNPKDMKEHRMAIELSTDIAVQALKSGMMSNKTKDEIKKNIDIFLSPTITKTHGRPIFIEEAEKCGLDIDKQDINGRIWELSRKLYMRTNNLVSTLSSKCIESYKHSFTASAPKPKDG